MQNIYQETTVQEHVKFANPYPGLRPFLESESHLFFGRENQVSSVLQKLMASKFVAIVGNSGIGKSSFINCGILPKLKSSHPDLTSNEWDIIAFRPGNQPVTQLAQAISEGVIESEILSSTAAPSQKEVEEIINLKGSEGFSGLLKNIINASGKNLLLYIDQFEEVFRFTPEDENNIDQTSTFIDIVVQSAQNKKIPVYVVITMRSDYVGECSRFPVLTAAINESQFLIPQMTEEEKRSVIVGPCHVMGINISDNVVSEILEKVGDDADQLPVMQHALMRTWNYWEENKIGNEEINISHYRAIGGMESALSIHANEIFNNLRPELKLICEKCFKSLTEKGEEGRSFRRPAMVKELSEISQASVSSIKEIVESFRKPGVTILTPSIDEELEEETIVDISHESLMRIWKTLANWMETENESTKQYLKIAEAAELHQTGKGSLLKSPELQMATNWYHEEKPTKAWGVRHHVAFDRTIEYLLFSEKQFLRRQRLKARQQKRRLFVARLIAIIFGSGAVLAGLLVVFAVRQKNIANVQKKEADKQAKYAEEQATIAKQKSEVATRQTRIAEMETHRAKIKEKEATESREKAEVERRNALQQKEIATEASHKATVAEQKALKLRMFSIARSMSIKSLQEPNIVTKSLVSRQAYNFYFDNGGTGTDPDIYNALYYSVKALKGNSFNALPGHSDNVRAIVTNRNSSKFYSTGSDGKIYRWQEQSKLNFEKQLIDQEDDHVNKTMALSPNGKWLVVGGDFPYLLLFDLSNDKHKSKKIQTGSRETLFLNFTSDNKGIIYSCINRKINIWNFDDSKEIDQVSSKLNAQDISPDGRYLAVALENGTVMTYDLKHNFAQQGIYTEQGNKAITSLKYSENGKMLAIGNIKGTVRILNLNTGYITTLTGHTARVNQICFNHENSKLATASFDHTVRIWDLNNTVDQPVILDDHKDWVWSIGFSNNDSYLFAGCRDKVVRTWIMDIHDLAGTICSADTISRNLTQEEWINYVADDIDLECTCLKNCNN